MSEKTIYDNPTISEKIAFELKTPNALGETSSNPYEVSKITIYFVSRDYLSGNLQKYQDNELILEKNLNEFYFKEAEPIQIVGNEDYPAWLSTDIENAIIENTESCMFKYIWEPKGAREGDYFICWTWKPLPAGDVISSHLKFYLQGDTQQTTSLPTHQTKPKKYETLLERYLPEMFKDKISDSDMSPDVLDRLNHSIAAGFTSLENLTNQIVDLHDANCLHEFLLPYLSNYFGLKLKTDDPTRWRSQIKRAVPLYKKKGTKGGLVEALEHIGAKLNKISQLWQVVSSKTWQESFIFDGIDDTFILEKNAILPLDLNNFELWIKKREEIEWLPLTDEYIEIQLSDEGVTNITWLGGSEVDLLKEGDELKILYAFSEIANQNEQDIENYIRNLPLMDIRDNRSQFYAETKKNSDVIKKLPINSEFKIGQKLYSNEFTDGFVEIVEIINYSSIRVSKNALSNNSNALFIYKNFDYPPKNWNVRVIREEDPMFHVIVPERNPFFDLLNFGKVRTEFPYSENIYHMEEYNGSIRDSKNPCDIDKSFVDPCYYCASSSYDIDVEIESLSDDRIEEVKSVIKENTPFHSVMHTCNFIGGVNEFFASPQEEVEMLTTYSGSDFVVSGGAQSYFIRSMIDFETDGIKRSELANQELIYSGSGVCYNDEITVFCPGLFLSSIGLSPEGSFISIKSPSSIAGEYEVVPSQDGSVKILNPSSLEPITTMNSPFEGGVLNVGALTFDLNNLVKPIDGSLCNIEQDNMITIETGFDLSSLGIKTLKDVQNGNALYAWEIELPSYGQFQIKDIINNNIILNHNSSLPTEDVFDEDWILKDDGTEVVNSNNAKIIVDKMGKVTSLDNSFNPIEKIMFKDNYYQKINDIEYKIIRISDSNEYYLDKYDQGDINGLVINMREKIVKEKVGFLNYRGIRLESEITSSDLGISSSDGEDLNENNYFKENLIAIINDVAYWIYEINDEIMILSGAIQHFKTTGTEVNFEIYKYEKEKNISIQGQRKHLPDHVFSSIGRNGETVLFSDILDSNGNTITSLSGEENSIKDLVNQQEELSFEIEYKKGDENERVD